MQLPNFNCGSLIRSNICHTVLPTKAKERLVKDLEKRLDLDLDSILQSPKLRLQLSPAELDKQLLELYKNIADGPRGDVLRVLGGGQEVAFQDLFIKRRTAKYRRNQSVDQSSLSFGPFSDSMEAHDAKSPTVSQWVQQALSKNLENSAVAPNSNQNTKKSPSGQDNLKMCIRSQVVSHTRTVPFFTSRSQFCPPRSATRSSSLLI